MTHPAVTDDRTRAAHEALDGILVEVSELRTENGRLRVQLEDCHRDAAAQSEIIAQVMEHNRQLMAVIEAFMGVAQQVPQLGFIAMPAPPPPPPPPKRSGRHLDDPANRPQDFVDLP